MTSIDIPNSVGSIGDFAFYGCSGLTSIEIPNSVTSIGDEAFRDCRGLTSLIFHCNKIGNWFNYDYKTSIKNVTIGQEVKEIGASAFLGFTNLASIEIPDSVTSIEHGAFYNTAWYNNQSDGILYLDNWLIGYKGNKPTGTIIIRSGTKGIGDYAFYECSGVTSVTIPNSVTSIGGDAFSECTRLTSVTLNCKTVGSWFNDLPSINEIMLGDSVTSIGNSAFDSCSGLKTLTIGKSVTSIEKEAFSGCSGFHIISLAEAPPALNNTINAVSIEVPVGSGYKYAVADNWSAIDTIYSMRGGKKMYPVVLSVEGESIVSVNGIMELGLDVEGDKEVEIKTNSTFADYDLVMRRYSDITNTLAQKGIYTFTPSPCHKDNRISTYAYSAYNIQLDTSGTLLDQIGIENIDKVYSLKVRGDVNGTDILTIRKMSNLRILDLRDANIIDGGLSYYQDYVTSKNAIGDYFFKEKETLINIKLPNTITEIKSHAFDGCNNLKTITIPNNVTSIGGWEYYTGCNVFSGCNSLASVTLHCNVIDSWFSGLKSIKEVVLGDRVTGIGYEAFSGCTGLTSVTIPNSVTSIGDSAFYGCTGLTSVTIGNGVTSIGSCAFEGCTGLTSIKIPNSVTSIGIYAFQSCSNLTSVHISDLAAWCRINFGSNPLRYAHHLFLNGQEIRDLIIPDGVTSIGSCAFSECSGLTSVTIGNSVTSIGRSAFSGCSGLISVIIPNSVTSIENSTFSDCASLTSITIPNSVISIGAYAFYYCTGLTSIEIPNSVTSIGYRAFDGCSSLTSVVIPNSVTSIGDDAFDNCSALISVTILCPTVGSWFRKKTSIKELIFGESVTSVAGSAFYCCSGLTSLEIPNSVTSIGNNAFNGCSGLTSVSIGNGVTSIGGGAFSGCSGLASVTSLNPTPPKIESSTFDETTEKNATLNVPVGSKSIYWLHPYWENFAKIEEIDVSSVNDIVIDKKHDGRIYNVNGIKVNNGNLGKGIYIQNGKKVMVR